MGLELDSVLSDKDENEEERVAVKGKGRDGPPSPTLGERFSDAMNQANDQGTDIAASLAMRDLEGEGTVSADDLRSVLLANGRLFSSFSESEIEAILAMFDANGDGTVTLNEWFAAAGQTYDEDKAAVDTFVRLLGDLSQAKVRGCEERKTGEALLYHTNPSQLEDSVRSFSPGRASPTSEPAIKVSDFEAMVSQLDDKHNVPLKLVTKVALIVGGESDGMVSISEIFKLFKHKFDSSKFEPKKVRSGEGRKMRVGARSKRRTPF